MGEIFTRVITYCVLSLVLLLGVLLTYYSEDASAWAQGYNFNSNPATHTLAVGQDLVEQLNTVEPSFDTDTGSFVIFQNTNDNKIRIIYDDNTMTVSTAGGQDQLAVPSGHHRVTSSGSPLTLAGTTKLTSAATWTNLYSFDRIVAYKNINFSSYLGTWATDRLLVTAPTMCQYDEEIEEDHPHCEPIGTFDHAYRKTNNLTLASTGYDDIDITGNWYTHLTNLVSAEPDEDIYSIPGTTNKRIAEKVLANINDGYWAVSQDGYEIDNTQNVRIASSPLLAVEPRNQFGQYGSYPSYHYMEVRTNDSSVSYVVLYNYQGKIAISVTQEDIPNFAMSNTFGAPIGGKLVNYLSTYPTTYPTGYGGLMIRDTGVVFTDLHPEYNWTITSEGEFNIQYMKNLENYFTGINTVLVQETSDDWETVETTINSENYNPAENTNHNAVLPSAGHYEIHITHNQSLDPPHWEAFNDDEVLEVSEKRIQFYWDGRIARSGNTIGCEQEICNEDELSSDNKIIEAINKVSQDEFGIQSIVYAPIAFGATLFDATENCQPVSFNLIGNNETLPCIRPQIQNSPYAGILIIFQTVLTGMTMYLVSVRTLGLIKNVSSPNDDRIEVMQL